MLGLPSQELDRGPVGVELAGRSVRSSGVRSMIIGTPQFHFVLASQDLTFITLTGPRAALPRDSFE